jgi:acetyl-CoA/propionyl-CoA carboxylase biotin carboxyl carrier protein
VADGLPLSFTEAPEPRGHAIEFRINAEDVARGFLPAPGTIAVFEAPAGPGVRVDSGVAAGSVVAPQFDSLMAKLVVHGATREQALARARRALAEFRIDGVPSVLPFHRAVLQAPDFTAESRAEGGHAFAVHTRWIETDFGDTLARAVAASPRPAPLGDAPLTRTAIEVDGRRVVLGLPASLFGALAAGADEKADPGAPPTEAAADLGAIAAPAAGTLQKWLAADGATVAAGETVAVVEAMKMEIQITAPRGGTLRQSAAAGAAVRSGDPIGQVDSV